MQRSEMQRVVVVVPSHDEVELLGECLEALRTAARAVTLPVQVVVVLDACTDGSEKLLGPSESAVVLEARNVGAARAAGFTAAGITASTWCATTDADSRVHPGWLVAQLEWAARGADVVVGTVAARWESPASRVEALFTREYAAQVGPDGHRHVHGANLGLRGDAYLGLGGVAPLPAHEDVDLVERAEAAGLTLAWARDATVDTSTRTTGRTPEGFAHHLASLAARVDAEPGDLALGAA